MSASPFFHAEREVVRDTVRRFVREEIAPHAAEWDEAGSFPRELSGKAAAPRGIDLMRLKSMRYRLR